jgi:hypothetical protein
MQPLAVSVKRKRTEMKRQNLNIVIGLLLLVLTSCKTTQTSMIIADSYDEKKNQTTLTLLPYGNIVFPDKWTKTSYANSRFAKAGVSCFYDSEVLNSSFVHLMKFSAENPRLRKAAKRYGQVAEFENGKKTGNWEYFSEKGKSIITGLFESGKPSGIWTINDYKGKKAVVQYDFSTNKYITNNPYSYRKKGSDVAQNANTEEWFVLFYPNRKNYEKSGPLGGYIFASDLFVDLIEVPLEFWDTYTQYEYKATFRISNDNSTTFILSDFEGYIPDDKPSFPFLIMTNPESKIKKIEHSKLSKGLLRHKIIEALNFMPPWIYNETTEIEVYIPYVTNMVYKK